jgi:hypothetical protein
VSLELDQKIQRTAESILPYCIECELLVEEEPAKRRAKAEVIATFACLCEPDAPTPAGTHLAARLLAIILYLDDLPKLLLNDRIREMRDAVDGSSRALQCPQARAFATYLDDLGLYGDTTWFRRQFELCLSALSEEAQLLTEGPLNVASYKSVRPRVIFVEEYMWTWLLSEGLPFDGEALKRTVRLRNLASEVAYLVNDLGSVERERGAAHENANLVFLLEREEGMSEQEAIQSVIRMHNETAISYRSEANELRESFGTPAVLAIANIVQAVVRGNLATTKRLSAARYPGAERALAQLLDYSDHGP